MKMIEILIVILILPSVCEALAPPPVRFNEEHINAGGRDVAITFDGTALKLTDYKTSERGSNLIGLLILLSLLFWIPLFGYFLWKKGHLIDGIIGGLILFLITHVFYTFMKKKWDE